MGNDGKCRKHYPKIYNNETSIAQDFYPAYQRRSAVNGGNTCTKHVHRQSITMDNAWVVLDELSY